jgi:hypothetical protein
LNNFGQKTGQFAVPYQRGQIKDKTV